MIIQCDQCKTKFRLDDSKVSAAGVKVRCSRCKNTFVVQKEVSEVKAVEPESSLISESPAPEIKKQEDPTAALKEEKNTFFSGDESEIDRNEGSLLSMGDQPSESEDITGNVNDNRISPDDFSFAGTAFHDTGKTQDETLEENRENSIDEDDREFTFQDEGDERHVGADSTASTGLFDEENEDFFGTADKDFFGADDYEKKDFPASPENDFELGAEPESGSEESFGMSIPEPDAGAEPPYISGKEFFFDRKEDDPTINESISDERDDYGFSPSESSGQDLRETGDDFVPADSVEESAPAEHSVDDLGMMREDLPPLAITSRKKKSRVVPIIMTVLLLAVVVAGGAAYYFSWIDFSAFTNAGEKSAKSIGNEIVIRNLEGAYIRNAEGGEMLVVTGEAFNQSDKVLSSVRVQGYVYGRNGEVLLKNSANFLNTLSREQLTSLPVNEIKALTKVDSAKAGDDAAMQPGTAATFQIVFTEVPEHAGEYGAEVTGSSSNAK